MTDPISRLRSPEVIRTRCRQILASLTAGESSHFVFDPSRLAAAAEYGPGAAADRLRAEAAVLESYLS